MIDEEQADLRRCDILSESDFRADRYRRDKRMSFPHWCCTACFHSAAVPKSIGDRVPALPGLSRHRSGYRTQAGEIDLIAWDGEVLVFVEVKARSARELLPKMPSASRKQQRMIRAAHMAISLPRRRLHD